MAQRQNPQCWLPIATRLSRHTSRTREGRAVSVLARGSLAGLLVVCMTSGCIVADPPQFTDPVRTPPQPVWYLATPPLTQVLSVFTPQGPSFSVPIRSEDAGEDLSAIFFRDYNSADQRLLNIQSISASTYSDVNRTISSTRLPVGDQDKGCHTVTLVVAHASSFQAKNKLQLDPAKAETDAALVIWWVNFNPPEDALNTLADCPTPVLP